MKRFNISGIGRYFQSEIAKRGYMYFKKGHVSSAVLINKNTIDFIVSGTINYEVRIAINEADDYSLECNCPYAEQDNCKHMAACLYYLQEYGVEKGNSLSKSAKPSRDKKLKPLDIFKLNLTNRISKLYGRDSYINYYKGYDFVCLIAEYCDKVQTNIDNEEYSLAIDQIFYLFDVIDTIEMDGSNGEHGEAISIVNETLGNITEYKFDDIAAKILELASKEGNIVTVSDILGDLVFNIVTKETAIQMKSFLKYLIEQGLTDELQISSIDYLKYLLVYLIYNLIDQKQALDMAKKDLDNHYIKGFLLKKLEENKEYDEAIEILEQYGSTIDWRITDHDHQLMRLYKLSDNLDEYKSFLLKCYERVPDYELYCDIKESFDPKDFHNMRDKLLALASKNSRYDNAYIKICLAENLIDKLFNYCKNSGIYQIDKYLDKFKGMYDKELLTIYKAKILEMAEEARNRKRYQDVVYFLFRLNDLKDGNTVTKEIVDYIRTNYKSRPAFQEELDFVERSL